MQSSIIRIALIGPESTGKTTLANQLADHYKTVWVREFARDYVAKLNRKYTYEDVLQCITMQAAEEKEALTSAHRFLFADTELILHKIWLWDVFKTYPPELDEEINKIAYDLYLLLYPDLPFVEDPVRENPHRRMYFFELYKQELEKRNLPFKLIKGDHRFQKAVEHIDSRFK